MRFRSKVFFQAVLCLSFLLLITEIANAQYQWPFPNPNQQGVVTGSVGEYRRTGTGPHRFHQGVDLTNGANHAIHAINSGIVNWNGDSSYGGSIITVTSSDGTAIRYIHTLPVLAIRDGTQTTVAVGNHISDMIVSSSTHLHLESNDINFLARNLNPYQDRAAPYFSTATIANGVQFFRNGLNKNTGDANTLLLNGQTLVQGNIHTILYSQVDIVAHVIDPRTNSDGSSGGGQLVPSEISWQVRDHQNRAISNDNLRFYGVPNNAAAVNGFHPSTTSPGSPSIHILTSHPRSEPYDRFWNTRLRSGQTETWINRSTDLDARSNLEARYPDGQLNVVVEAHDVDYQDDPNMHAPSRVTAVVIDNFRPFIKEVIVRKNHDQGTMAYRAYWQWTGTALSKVIAFNPVDINPQENAWLKIITSEPVNNLRINVPAANGSSYITLTPLPNTNSSEFTYCLNPIAAQQSHLINIQAEDLAGNPLQTNPALIPIRQANGTWSTGVSPGVDSQHFFNVGTGTCGDGSSGGRVAKAGRTSSSSCLYADFTVDSNLIGSSESVTFAPIASGSGTLTYSWNFGSGATPATSTSSGQQTVIYNTSGTKTVSLTICDGSANCVTEQKANFISVGVALQEIVVDFERSAGAGDIGTNFQLTNTVTGAVQPVVYAWNFGDVTTIGHFSDQHPIIAYAAPGNKSISLTVTDATGRSATQSKNNYITIFSRTLNIVPTVGFCGTTDANGNITLSASADGGNGYPYDSYKWDFGDGTYATTASRSMPHRYLNWGKYTVRLTVCDETGCGIAEQVGCVTVPSIVSSGTLVSKFKVNNLDPIGPLQEVGLNTPVKFTSATTGGGDPKDFTYSWRFDMQYGGTNGNSAVPRQILGQKNATVQEVYYTTPGNKMVTLTVVNLTTSHASPMQEVVKVVAGRGPGSCVAILGEAVASTSCYSPTTKPKFTIPVASANCPIHRIEVMYWPHDGVGIPLPNGVLDFEALGITPTFPVTANFDFTAYQYDGVNEHRIGFSRQRFTIYGPVIADAGTDKQMCLNSATPIGPIPSEDYSYKWTSTSGMPYLSNSITANPEFSAVANGAYNYTLKVTDTNSGCTAADNLMVTVSKPEVTTSKAWAPLGVATPLTAIASSGFGNYTYNWVPATRLSSATVATPNFTSAAEGNFEYLVTVTDQTGCTASTNVSVNASSVPGNLVATAEAYERISLKWIDRSPNETSFVVQRSVNGGTFSTVATVSANVIKFDDVNVLPSNTYTYKVAAIISGSTGTFSNEASVSTASLPAFTFVDMDSKGYADLDGDGDMDYVRITVNTGKTFFEVMQNAGGTFVIAKSDLISNGIINHELIMARFGDFDNDNDLDILLSFYNGFSQGPLLYINTAGTFFRYNLPVYSQVYGEAYPTIDYTSDNDVDLVVSGSLTGKSTAILENIGTTQFQVVETGISGVDRLDYWHRNYTMIMAADTDNDGDQDLIMPRSSPVYEECQNEVIYLNENNVLSDLNFKTVLWRNASNPDLAGGQDIADFDNDGIKDILKIGKGVTSGAGKANLWKGDGSNNFTEVSAGQLLNVSGGQTQFGDYDMDGDYDVFVSGDGAYESYVHRVYTNNNNSFSIVASPTTLLKEWVDFDGDGDLDILAFNGDIYRNNLGTSLNTVNTTPTTPSNLCVFFNGTTATFTWDPSTDSRTRANGLTYNLYVKQNGTFVLSPLANLTTGFRKIVARGNVDLNTSWTIKLPSPGNVEWGVQAIDNSFTGSVFAHSTVNPVQTECGVITSSRDVVARDIIFPYNCSPNAIVVSNGAKLTAAADNVLKLLPGFSVQAGSIFTGKITSYTEAESPCVRTSSGGRIGEDEEGGGSNNKKADEVFVYPNPGDGVYNVRFNFAKPGEQVRCFVTDLDGKIVFEKNFYNVQEAVEAIDILKSSSGVYLLKVVNDGKIIYRKIIKF